MQSISHIATLATRAAIDDLRLLLASLETWNTPAPAVYLYCDSFVQSRVASFAYKGPLQTRCTLDEYTEYTRAEMERLPGKARPNLFFDFVCEKMNLLDWAFSSGAPHVLFCDADICFLAPLFSVPNGTVLAVSQHMIRAADEARFGVYNVGMIWMGRPELVGAWRDACDGSRFYEQVPMEAVVASLPPDQVYKLPKTENYGWWRLWQGIKSSRELLAEWGMNRRGPGCGITVGGAPLGSVHTHFKESRDVATAQFNSWVIHWLKKLAEAKHVPAKQFLKILPS
jgi:hypothetical protein